MPVIVQVILVLIACLGLCSLVALAGIDANRRIRTRRNRSRYNPLNHAWWAGRR